MTQTATALQETVWDMEQPEQHDSELDFHDISLIQDKLRLTPLERLRAAEAFVRNVHRLRHAKPT